MFFTCLILLSACRSSAKDPLTVTLTIQENIIELLQNNGGCELPCFLGITTGQTSWSEAKLRFEKLTSIREDSIFYQDGDFPAYLLVFTLNDVKPYRQFTLVPTVSDKKIQRIYINVEDDPEVLSQYWKKYSIKEVFSQLGKPEKVLFGICSKYSHPCFEGLIIYEKKKVAVKFFGENLPENSICPQLNEGGEISSISLSIANPLSELNVLPPDWIPADVKEYWTPIKDILGIDENEFYKRILSDKLTCFKVIATR